MSSLFAQVVAMQVLLCGCVMPPPNRHRDRTNDEEPMTKRARTEHGVPGPASASAQRITELARIDDASRELLASIAKEGFVPLAQLEHDGPLTKKSKDYKMGNHLRVTIRATNESAQSEKYHGVCIGSGQWKEVFLLQGAEGTFHNHVLKVTKLVWPKSQGFGENKGGLCGISTSFPLWEITSAAQILARGSKARV